MSPPRPITLSTTTSNVILAPRTAGRKLGPVWAHVDIDPESGVWCKKCSKLIQTTGQTHVERVKHHLEKICASRATTPLITDMFRPKVKVAVLKKFHEKLALCVYSSGVVFFKIEHDSLFEALQVLAPGIKSPNRDHLLNALLGSTYDKSLKTMTAALQGKVVTISSEG